MSKPAAAASTTTETTATTTGTESTAQTAAAETAIETTAAEQTAAAATEAAAETAAATTETETTTAQTAAAPEAYELALPENALLDATDLAFVEAEAKALGLSQEQAQSLVETRNATVLAMADSFLQEAKADPEIGGAKWDDTVKHAREGLAFMFAKPDELAMVQGWLNKTALGNHPVFLRAMARIGKARAEDPTPAGGTSRAGAAPVSAADRMYGTPAQ